MEVDSVTPFPEEITEGETDTIQVTLATEPTADSTVTVTITATTGLTVSEGGTMTFTSANWDGSPGADCGGRETTTTPNRTTPISSLTASPATP